MYGDGAALYPHGVYVIFYLFFVPRIGHTGLRCEVILADFTQDIVGSIYWKINLYFLINNSFWNRAIAGPECRFRPGGCSSHGMIVQD